jgi:hypothetical protein
MEHGEYCARAGAEITRIAAVTEGAAPQTPVPACPGWDLARLISLGRGGYRWSHGHAKGSVAVRGPAGLLLLLIYGRVRPDDERLQVFGDAGLLATWQQVMTLQGR